ncbi:MAG: acyltransferase [Solirubrobacterales bacterium]|nr:acyltransferase [Solirubrobacterales bacterium]
MDRLSALDASFLRVETPTAHMHVGWLATADLPAGADALRAEAVMERIEGRLHLLPRFRQVIREPPGGLVAPHWVDADRFAIADHVTVHDEPPSSTASLHALAEDFFSVPLSRDRPLWQLLVVPRMAGGRAAILGKVHHAMVDGVAAVQLGLLLFDGDAEAVAQLPVPWRPQPASNPMRTALDGARDTALEQFRSARRAAHLGLSPGKGLRMADTARRAAFGLANDVRYPAPASYLNVPIGPRRRLVGAALPLSRALAIKERTGTKLNDVVLATVAGALARLAPAHGEDAIDLRAMVPANVRSGASEAQGNAISFLFVDLPVQARPAERLRLVSSRMRALKDDGRVAGSDQMLKMLGYLPGPLQGQAARMAASPRLYNVTVSNVPGPRVPLYLAGGRVRSILPVIPIPDRHALAIGALTYENRLHLSAYLDPETLPRADGLPTMLADAFEELELATAA